MSLLPKVTPERIDTFCSQVLEQGFEKTKKAIFTQVEEQLKDENPTLHTALFALCKSLSEEKAFPFEDGALFIYYLLRSQAETDQLASLVSLDDGA